MSRPTYYELTRTDTYTLTVDSDDEIFKEFCEENGIDPLNASEDNLLEYDRENLTEHDYVYEETEIELNYVH